MKKIIIMAVAAFMATTFVQAQDAEDFLLRTRLTGNLSTVTNNSDAKNKVGFGFVVSSEYLVSNKVGIGIDLSSDRVGYKSKSLDKSVNLDYIGLAPMVRYYVAPWFMLEGGPQISYLTKAKVDDNSVRDGYKKVEFAIPVGFAFEPKLNDNGLRLSIGIRYHLGLSKINKEGDAHRNSGFFFATGVSGW